MLSSITNQVFKLEEILNPSTPEETPNFFQPLEKVKIKTQKQDCLKKLTNA